MVYFECGLCIKVLKKKQVETHYQFECRAAQNFCCLTCFKFFDRDAIKAHISCVTEQEKYKMNDHINKKNLMDSKKSTPIVAVNLDSLDWSGFRKTTKKILMSQENYKLSMKDTFERLAIVYSRTKGVHKDEVCLDKLKKNVLNKLESDERFVLDLSKSTFRYKI